MRIIYAIFDNYKSCYDCPDQIHSIYANKELALKALHSKFCQSDIKSGYAYIDELELIEG
ncbi:hypothetical protein barba126A_phanotate61 [Rheinheimera phage vB_RspM_barba_12-6A]|nr:hypothetical protein barba109A_phanotate12 [Rheinheimera phage vB_RspM_barba_10-9A]QNO02170.1 hypothetical protein barba109B_phanotate12 [Rheinheimera phage vB_RspM_barba_10-9B]QNO02481.1 hypothetical protein barba109C_phanotate160 [Rheinheimera phage vB_RspM_barba_10-9C]QNO02489.1 hypothetical protein barba109D_phanotate5 [Rheinheimera phage vB_RspM_barba_10-9D]QNO02736.1 hypothetical protein barba109E_phanotate88 [Rheinheimera phage vB_RspM_barba_10-9E]QNO02818.1 hypothetical protein barb